MHFYRLRNLPKLRYFILLISLLSAPCFANCRGIFINNSTEVDFDGVAKQCITSKNVKGQEYTWCPEKVQQGTKISSISQYIKNVQNQSPVYCVHGGNCYPAKDLSVSNPCILGIFEK